MRSFLKRTLPMDEINDLRTPALESSDRWGVRYRFEGGQVHVDRIDSVAGAMASVAPLRRPPTLKVIQGGLHAWPKRISRDLGKDRSFLVVVK